MCSAQPVITAALMWSLGGTEASYYCRFMTTFALWLLPACPPLSFLSLSPSPSPPLLPPHFSLHPSVQTHIHLSSRCNGTPAVCLQCASHPVTSLGQRLDLGGCLERREGHSRCLQRFELGPPPPPPPLRVPNLANVRPKGFRLGR